MVFSTLIFFVFYMDAQQELIDTIKAYNPNINLERLQRAIAFGAKAHSAQKRASGEPYFDHPLAVAKVLADMQLDEDTIITALLHDTVEDTEVTLEDIEREFGRGVSRLVDGVTKLTKIEFQPEYIRQAENFRKLLVAMSEDIRVLLVKLADRLHNMRTLHFVQSQEKRIRIAHETMEIYASLAERIGIQQIKNELQDLAFKELHPDAHASIVSRLEFLHDKGGNELIHKVVDQLQTTLHEGGVKAKVFGREKTPCSIWRKMEGKNISFEQLTDIIAFRIIADTVEGCYHALGAVHAAYHMIPDSFKDYISTPKTNGYRSLHTIVMGPEQQIIEIQIRTAEMHEVAEWGVAAHWGYKQGEDPAKTEGTQYRWIRELLYILEHAAGPEEFLENTRLEMYYDQVFCFTPKGHLIALPRGATPVDFAYAVHSDIGNTCAGAKVNGRIVPLRTVLKNGDQVDIICTKTQVPSPTWEKFVVTAKAKSEIRRFVRTKQREEYVNLGRAILSKALRQEGFELTKKMLEPALKVFRKKTIDGLLASVGEGLITREEVVKVLFPNQEIATAQQKKATLSSFFHFGGKPEEKKKQDIEPLIIKGLIPGMAMHLAGCCHPIPGDKIVGIVNTGKGVTIHTVDCETLENFAGTPERWIDVSWEKESGEKEYIGRIKVILSHEPGSLAEVANTIAKDLGNIHNLAIVNRTSDFFEIVVDVEVRGTRHLTNIIANLRTKPCIHSVERR